MEILTTKGWGKYTKIFHSKLGSYNNTLSFTDVRKQRTGRTFSVLAGPVGGVQPRTRTVHRRLQAAD